MLNLNLKKHHSSYIITFADFPFRLGNSFFPQEMNEEHLHSVVFSTSEMAKLPPNNCGSFKDTVDGWNPAPPGMYETL